MSVDTDGDDSNELYEVEKKEKESSFDLETSVASRESLLPLPPCLTYSLVSGPYIESV